MVHVSVVNCADEKNSGVCRAHAIDAFPTIKVSLWAYKHVTCFQKM